MRDSIVRIRWQLDILDKGGPAQLLKTDRALRASVEATDRAITARARAAKASSGAMVRAAGAEQRATERAARAAQRADREVSKLGRSSLTTGRAIVRTTSSINQQAGAYGRVGREAERAARRTEAAARRQERAAARMGRAAATGAGGLGRRTVGLAGVAAGGIGVGMGLRSAIGMGVQYNKVIDAQNVGFTTLLKSQERAARFMAQIQRLAIDSPILDVQTTGQAARTIMAYGVALKDTLPLVRAIGDASAASGKNIAETLPQAALAIGQVASKGKLQAQEMNQLAQAVGLSRTRIRRQLGMTRSEFEATFTPGNNIPASRALPAIQRALREQSGGASGMLSRTTQGQTLRAKEMLAKRMGELERPLYDFAGRVAGRFADALQRTDFRQAGRRLADKVIPVFDRAIAIIGRSDLSVGERIGKLFDAAAPVVLTAVGDLAVRAAETFARAWWGAGVWGKLFAGLFLAKKLGAFGALGRLAAGAFAGRFGRRGGGGIAGGGLGGVASIAKPVPVFVTNPGFGGRGAPTPVPSRGPGRVAQVASGAVRAAGIAGVAYGGAAGINALLKSMGIGTSGNNVSRGAAYVRREADTAQSDSRQLVSKPMIRREIEKINAELVKNARLERAAAAAGAPADVLKSYRDRRAALNALLDDLRAKVPVTFKPMTREMGLMAGRVTELRGRLRGLTRGTDAYRTVASQLRDAQAMLNATVRGGSGAFRGVGESAKDAARAMDTAAATIDARVATLAANLRARGIAFTPAGSAGGRRAQDVTFGPIRRISPGDGRRRGGIVGYSTGGLVPAYVSSGELVVEPDGSSWTVPGRPVAADNVFANLTAGSAVLTYDGQARLAAGASLNQAIAGQAPHFREGGDVLTPGQMASLAYRQGRVRPARAAIRMGAIGMRESGGRPWARNYDPPRDDSWGLWQINVLPQANPQFQGWKLTNPAVNATAMGRLYRAAGERPWGGYPESSFSRWIPAATRGFRASGTNLSGLAFSSRSDRTTKVPARLGRDPLRGGLLDDAFTASMEAARSGLPIGRARFLADVRAAMREVQTTRDITIRGTPRPRRSTSSLRPGGGWGGSENIVKQAIRGLGTPSSTKRSTAINGNQNSDHNTWNKTAYAADIPAVGAAGDRIFSTIARRVGIPARKGSWNRFPGKPRGYRSQLLWQAPDGTHTTHVHYGVRKLRRGGHVSFGGKGYDPRPSAPTRSNRPLSPGAVIGKGRGWLAQFSSLADDALSGQLEGLRRRLIRQARRGGDAKAITRLRAAISALDDELGLRVGRIVRRVDLARTRTERRAATSERLGRQLGIDPGSAVGLQLQIATGAETIRTGRANIRRLQRAVAAARSAGQPQVAQALLAELAEARDALEEAGTQQVERQRDLLRAAAQENVDTAQFGLDSVQGALAGLDTQQRLAGTAETPGGMIERARAIDSQLIPALTAQQAALAQQLATAQRIGDVPGARQTYLALQQAGNDIATAIADSAQLVREAAMTGAQEAVDVAERGSRMATLSQARLELEQRIAGGYDTGGQKRAELIRASIIPAIEAEIAALQGQQRTAQQQGDAKLAAQIAEAIYGRQNDVLQAQLDAQEQIAANTNELRRVGGTLGFGYANENLTDALISTGNGS